MKAIIYASEALQSFDRAQLNELVGTAFLNNRKTGITGYISYSNGEFLQYLEGPENAVDKLMASIEADERHKIKKSLVLGKISQRRFGSWNLLDLTEKSSLYIGIQDLIKDVVLLFRKDASLDVQSNHLILEMLDKLSKIQKKSDIRKMSFSSNDSDIQRPPPYIVVLGASAGGLSPLQTIVKDLDSDLNVAFIVVQHLAPNAVTVMDTILQREASMKVLRAAADLTLNAGEIYVIPPGENLEVKNGKFLLSKQKRIDQSPQFTIDICLSSVSREYGDRSIAVVMSGTGSDGSRGAREIHEAGGIVLVQSLETAEFDGMPRSTIDTGIVHHVLAPSEISDFINTISIKSINDSRAQSPAQRTIYISKVVSLLCDNDIDFTHYKDETLYRRIERRRVLLNVPTTERFIELLKSSETERDDLREDILITVTGFFRDSKAWDILSQSIYPIMVSAMSSGETFRVWVAACSTGEEAYSVAILLDELIEKLDKPLNYKIYATDIERSALERAGDGFYSEKSLSHISETRRQRYFDRRGDSYVVSSKLRDNVIFATHNFIKNAPFSQMHLVTCRNVLIYMQPQLQQLAIKMLHFSLKVNGILFLGPSETLGNLQSEFYPVQREWNQYKKLRNLRLPMNISSELADKSQLNEPLTVQPMQLKNEAKASGIIGLSLDALTQYTGSTNVLVDAARNVLMVISDPSGLLQVHTGEPSLDIARMVPDALRTPLTFGFDRAFAEHTNVTHRRLSCKPIGQLERHVDIEIIPHAASGENEARHALIVIRDVSVADGATYIAANDDDNGQVNSALRAELAETKQALTNAINDLESSSNQQRSINEQLSAANEELQSTNEELQSVNEELYTVNFEYQTKIHELSELNQDLDNLLDSTNLGVIFLDTDLCIRRFTDVATQTVSLLPSDIGRPFVDLAHNLQYDDLIHDLRRVLSTGKTISREIARNKVDLLQVAIHPYRAGDGVAHGVLIMFRDTKKSSNEALAEITQELVDPDIA